MKAKLLWVLVVMVVVVGVVFAVGVDDQGNPNDPTVNERANACFDGGTLAGKCDSELEWIAGWYLIRLEFGMISSLPAWLSWILPENYIAAVETEEPVAGPVGLQLYTCYSSASSTTIGQSFYLISTSGLSNGRSFFSTDCSGYALIYTFVIDADQKNVDLMCDALSSGTVGTYTRSVGFNNPSDVAFCAFS